MFVKIQGEITQLTEYLQHLTLEGPDLSALYILEAKLTILLHSLPAHRLLPLLFSPHQAQTLLSTATQSIAPSRPYPIRESDNSHFSLGQCSRLRFKVSQDAHSFKELSLLSFQILESLEEWKVIMSKSRTIQKQIQVTESDVLLLNRYQEDDENSVDSIQKVIHEAITENPSSEYSMPDRLSGDQAAYFLEYLTRWSSELQRQIADFKAAIKPLKDDMSVDMTIDRPTEPFLEAKRKELPILVKAQSKKKGQIGMMEYSCAKKQKKAKKVRQGCPQLCSIY